MPAPATTSAAIEGLDVAAFRVPTDAPESDGTFAWEATTMVVVHAHAGGMRGLGYSYTAAAAAPLIRDVLQPAIRDVDALAPTAAWHAMLHAVRNIGLAGVAAAAISAVDAALWDLKARLLGLPLVTLLGAVRETVPVYGSGGFTSYGHYRLRHQLEQWVDAGITRVKMKVGRDPATDEKRVREVRAAIGPGASLFVDANGAWRPARAIAFAERFARYDVSWFEEPVSSDDLDGLARVRDHSPAGMDIAAGEYGYDTFYFRRMLDARAVDVLQADATRCCGITGFMQVATLCEARAVPLSAHTAPALHLHACCALHPVVHMEYFHDHARIEGLLFDGAAEPMHGALRPDLSSPGMGLELRPADADEWRVDA